MDAQSLLLAKIDAAGNLWQEQEVHLKRNEILHNAGTIATNVYFVSEGALRIYHQNGAAENTIRFGYKNSLFASLDSFLTAAPSVYTVQALRKTELKVMPKKVFFDFINSDAENMQLWTAVLGYTVVSLLERETDLLVPTPQERYARVLQRSPQLFQHIPHKHIASYLRMAPETLSRLKKS